MNRKWLMSLLVLFFAFFFVSNGQEKNSLKDSIQLCNIPVPELIKRANASFYVIYKLDLDSNGIPSQITMAQNDFIEDKFFRECLKEWILPAPNRRITVFFYWRHTLGWEEIFISGLDVNRRIILRKSSIKDLSRM